MANSDDELAQDVDFMGSLPRAREIEDLLRRSGVQGFGSGSGLQQGSQAFMWVSDGVRPRRFPLFGDESAFLIDSGCGGLVFRESDSCSDYCSEGECDCDESSIGTTGASDSEASGKDSELHQERGDDEKLPVQDIDSVYEHETTTEDVDDNGHGRELKRTKSSYGIPTLVRRWETDKKL